MRHDSSGTIPETGGTIQSTSGAAAKRMLDVVVAAPLLFLLAPVVLVVAVAIAVESRGGVFYRCRRVGWRGRELQMRKRRAALLAKTHLFDGVRYCGEHSIVIYLAFFLFMAATRVFLLKTGLVPDIGLMSVIVTGAGVLGPLMLYWTVRSTPLRFLFERPERFWLTPRRRVVLQPAE